MSATGVSRGTSTRHLDLRIKTEAYFIYVFKEGITFVYECIVVYYWTYICTVHIWNDAYV